jgi:DNA-binding CsgD family transcriptional regulator
MPPGGGTAELLERGRDSYARMDWAGAHAALSSADRARPLEADDLELVATAAYMLGRDEEYLQILERAHRLHLEEGRTLPAVRCAFWVGANLAQWGEIGHATGWLGRAQRLLEREEGEHVEHGYLLLPVVLRCAAGGDYAAAAEAGAQAAAVGERFADPDLFALAVQEQGKIMVRLGRVDEGLSLLDEAMVAATAGELSPIVTGLVYCSVIAGCQEVYDLRRAQEWTAALTRWCDQQPDLLAFTGQCLVHRAEILQLRGAWQEALREARRARERLPGRKPATTTSADALYRQGEVLRQLGRFGEAEDAYRQASRAGCEPLPGLALLRMAQGDADAAAAAIRRVVAETTAPVRRAHLLPAYVEIMLAAGDRAEARSACAELEAVASGYQSALLAALVAYAHGLVELADGEPRSALPALREAARRWQDLDAPYEAARAREQVALACRALGDDDAAAMELEAAHAAFGALGAAPDANRVAALMAPPARRGAHGLTARELEVLRLVAAGKSNREIASLLVVSEHTVARHVQNILAKLDVPSRTAAGAFAFRHDLA